MSVKTVLKEGICSRFCLVGIIALLAFSTRILPSAISPYPFNNDSLTECEMAVDILQTGHLDFSRDAWYFDTHSTVTPVYNVLLASVSSVIGTDVYSIAQLTTAAIAVFSVLAGYLIALELTGSRKSSLAVAMTLSLFGTLVFFTGSSWKSAIGFSFLVFLVYAFAHRSEKRYLVIQLVILATLPLIHHLAMAIGYLSFGYLTIISTFLARRSGTAIRRQSLVDFTILILFSLAALAYYESQSLDRLSMVLSQLGLVNLGIAFAAIGAISVLLLTRKKHMRITLAPVAGIVVFMFFILDRSGSLFEHSYSGPDMVLILAIATSVLLSIAWYGLERVQRSKSRHKAIPFALLLPVITLFLVAILNGPDLQAHQIFYRSFDFADLTLALGIGFALKSARDHSLIETTLVGVLICALLITFPFSYVSGTLIGVRHDTQAYEVDAIEWVQVSAGDDAMLQTDERLAYIAMALYDFEKAPYLPDRLVGHDPLLPVWLYLYEEEWSYVGVNNYPNGYELVDPDRIDQILASSSVLYVGGPSDNNAIVFSWSAIGYEHCC